jgi:cell wall-associated NlpC family hydrolase
VQTVVQTAATPGSGAGSIRGTDVRLRSGPSMNSETISYLGNGTKVSVHGACGAWYEVSCNGNVGYVYGDYVVLSGQTVTYSMTAATTLEEAPIFTEPVTEQTYVEPEPLPTQNPTPAVQETTTSFIHNAVAGQTIVDTAMKFRGTPYVWGGTSPSEGFDCSGFVYYVYGLHGYTLNRVAQAMYYNGVDVDLSDLQPGDILLFGSSVYNIWHAGLYVGNGIFIHSPHSGQVVSTQALSDTYGMRRVAARRIV